MGATWDRAKPFYLGLVLAFLTALAVLALLRLEHVLLILFVSILFASALSGPTAKLEEWRLPIAISVPLIYLSVLAVVVAFLWIVTPALFAQLASFADEAPAYADRSEGLRSAYDDIRDNYPTLAPFETQVARLGQAIFNRVAERALRLPTDVFKVFIDLLSVFVISTLIVSSRRRLLAAILLLVHPDHRAEVRDVLRKMWSRIGYYVRAKVIVMTIDGTLMYIALRIIGVPFAVPLAIIVALGEVVPRVGPWLARIPLFGIAALDGLQTLGLTVVASVLIENLKGFVISPLVESRQLDIPPLVVFLAVLVGSALFGLGGAIVAVPAAAMLQVLGEEVIVPWRQRQLAVSAVDPVAPDG